MASPQAPRYDFRHVTRGIFPAVRARARALLVAKRMPRDGGRGVPLRNSCSHGALAAFGIWPKPLLASVSASRARLRVTDAKTPFAFDEGAIVMAAARPCRFIARAVPPPPPDDLLVPGSPVSASDAIVPSPALVASPQAPRLRLPTRHPGAFPRSTRAGARVTCGEWRNACRGTEAVAEPPLRNSCSHGALAASGFGLSRCCASVSASRARLRVTDAKTPFAFDEGAIVMGGGATLPLHRASGPPTATR